MSWPNRVLDMQTNGRSCPVWIAIVEGFRCIGIEREAEYLPLIDQRIARACPPLDFGEPA